VPKDETVTVDDLIVDTGTLNVTRSGQELILSPIGYKILMLLINAAPKVVSRREIEGEIWGEVLPDSDTLRSHLYNLRKAVDKPFEKKLIHTITSRGYRIGDV